MGGPIADDRSATPYLDVDTIYGALGGAGTKYRFHRSGQVSGRGLVRELARHAPISVTIAKKLPNSACELQCLRAPGPDRVARPLLFAARGAGPGPEHPGPSPGDPGPGPGAPGLVVETRRCIRWLRVESHEILVFSIQQERGGG